MITIDKKIACLAREVALREQVYPRFVASGKLTKTGAAEELETMQAVLNDYIKLRESAQPSLF